MLNRGSLVMIFLAVGICSSPSLTRASLMISGNHPGAALSPGASLDDVRLEVSLSVAAGRATTTWTNASVAPEDSAVFKTLFMDLEDDDTGEAVLWNPTVRNDLSDGVYTVGAYNVLPGFNLLIVDGASMVELNAANPAPHEGIAPGQSLIVEFDTSLPDGSDIFDYLAFFDGGADSEAYCLGFHAISSDTIVNDGSLSGAHVPEPTSAILLLAGVGCVFVRRRR